MRLIKQQLKSFPHSGGFRHGWFYDEVYRANFRVIFPCGDKELTNENVNHYLKTQYSIDFMKDKADWNAMTLSIEGEGGPCAWVFAFRKAVPSIDEITHESVHAANRIYASIGAEVDRINDEPYAYLVGSIARRICLCLGRK